MNLSSTVDRRLLVSWRADPEIVAGLLPAGMQPTIVAGSAVVGVCAMRLVHTRPAWLPAPVGCTSESAAHRVAVTSQGEEQVFIWQRHSASRINQLAGGRLFPGVMERARFDVRDTPDRLRISVAGRDDDLRIALDVQRSAQFESEVFADLAEASAFYERAAVGLSPGRDAAQLEGMRLHTDAWAVQPVDVLSATSSFFDDTERFPRGSIVLDSALLMRRMPVTWSPTRATRTRSRPGRRTPLRDRARHHDVGTSRTR